MCKGVRCLTLHGFKTLLGSDCHDYPKIPHLYKSYENYSLLYGKGITYTHLLEDNLHNNSLDDTITHDIETKYYDIIIYGSYHRGIPLYKTIIKHYQPHEIIFICGEDDHSCNWKDWTNVNHNVFVRELYL